MVDTESQMLVANLYLRNYFIIIYLVISLAWLPYHWMPFPPFITRGHRGGMPRLEIDG